ncbi:general transcription factor IIH subunit 3-like isoform X2 [Branchiostoma floridae]|uniref:General transcription factor IIH subunit 3 n=1 Tax=Branchiostoma floridae TaxID=7739 RepID=A0A9J7LWL8_BRAFL|nr:general transcription factor IIH subunit 3-like isoform X2 [Branchiostoma floridae]
MAKIIPACISGEENLLVVIIDCNPVWWGRRQQQAAEPAQIVLSHCLDAIQVFVNSYLMLSHKNRVAVIASHTSKTHFLYPKNMADPRLDQRRGEDGRYEQFATVDDTVVEEIKQFMTSDTTSRELKTDTLLAGSLAVALCYVHRLEKEYQAGQQLNSRVLVIKAAEDSPSQYMNLMNVIFTAQKQNVVIDACILDKESGLLQQASDITGGIYLKIPQMSGLLQYLLWVFLPDLTMREVMALPPKVQVDYRAACFCHRTLIDIGYVCSVCLSIFCSFSPICSTCETAFKLAKPPMFKSKKKKRSLQNGGPSTSLL